MAENLGQRTRVCGFVAGGGNFTTLQQSTAGIKAGNG